MIYTLMGKSIEFYRLSANPKKDISIQEITTINGVSFCHRNTYMKMIRGAVHDREMYEQIMKINNLHYDYDEVLQEKTNELYKEMKLAIEFLDFNKLEQLVEKGFSLLSKHETIYPHAMDYFILVKIDNAYIKHENLDLKKLKAITFLLDIVCNDAKVILSELVYFDTHRRKGLVSSLKNVLRTLPMQDENELIFKLIKMRQTIYENDFESAFKQLEELRHICEKTNNVSRACELHQFYIAVYCGRGQLELAELEKNKLCEAIKRDDVSIAVKKGSRFYLTMCAFSEHRFDLAKPHMEEQIRLLGKDVSIRIVLLYLAILSYNEEENPLFTLTEAELRPLKSHYKVFLRYFVLKNKKRKKEVLINYILYKILLILDEDYGIETAIFYQELCLLGATLEEKEQFKHPSSKMDYSILHEWEKILDKQ